MHRTDTVLALVAELAAINTIDPSSGLRNATLSKPNAARHQYQPWQKHLLRREKRRRPRVPIVCGDPLS
jgi:hypothetical protein